MYNRIEKMEISDQDTLLALISSIVYIESCLHIYGMFTRHRAAGQSWEYPLKGGVEGKHPFSLLLSSWHLIGQVSTSHHGGSTHRVLPGARGRKEQRRT